jgi:hypothetical protein
MTIQLAPGTGVTDFAAIAKGFTTHEAECPFAPPEEQ